MKSSCRVALGSLLLVGGALCSDTAYTPKAKGTLTFSKDIAPIVFQNCSACHRDGEVAPFALMSYEDVKKKINGIVRVTKKRYMPPWKAEPGHGEFLDARRLSDEQIGMIEQWAEEGAAEGNRAAAPKPPVFKDGWQLGAPDLIVKMPEAYTVPAEGRDVYRCFVIPLNLSDDKYVSAVEYRPSNRKVVHHALFFLDATGQARQKDAADPGLGYRSVGGPGFLPSGGLGGWAPGAFPHQLPDGVTRPIKKGSDLVMQTHFHPSGKPELEQSSLGIYFSKKPPERVFAGAALGSRKIDIPPGEKNYTVSDSMTLPVDIELVGITPHAHLICKTVKAGATLPDGKTTPLIWIKDWDFNWQDQYQYKTPLKLPKGTRLDVEFTYDNSAENVRNPSNPPKRVRHGEQTTDEMALLFLQPVVNSKIEAGQLLIANALKRGGGGVGGAGAFGGDEGGARKEAIGEIVKRFDKDGDGKLSPAEREEALKFARERFGQ